MEEGGTEYIWHENKQNADRDPFSNTKLLSTIGQIPHVYTHKINKACNGRRHYALEFQRLGRPTSFEVSQYQPSFLNLRQCEIRTNVIKAILRHDHKLRTISIPFFFFLRLFFKYIYNSPQGSAITVELYFIRFALPLSFHGI